MSQDRAIALQPGWQSKTLSKKKKEKKHKWRKTNSTKTFYNLKIKHSLDLEQHSFYEAQTTAMNMEIAEHL